MKFYWVKRTAKAGSYRTLSFSVNDSLPNPLALLTDIKRKRKRNKKESSRTEEDEEEKQKEETTKKKPIIRD